MEIIHSLVITGSPMGEGESPMATPKFRPFLQKKCQKSAFWDCFCWYSERWTIRPFNYLLQILRMELKFPFRVWLCDWHGEEVSRRGYFHLEVDGVHILVKLTLTPKLLFSEGFSREDSWLLYCFDSLFKKLCCVADKDKIFSLFQRFPCYLYINLYCSQHKNQQELKFHFGPLSVHHHNFLPLVREGSPSG